MIRPMKKEDIQPVQSLLKHTWCNALKHWIPEQLIVHHLERTFSEAMLLKRMERTHIWILEDNGQPVGFLSGTCADEDGDVELTAMGVMPSHQQTGLGTFLLNSALQQLQQAKQVFVYIHQENWPARNFYEKMGFKLITVFEEDFEGHSVMTAQYLYQLPSNQKRLPG